MREIGSINPEGKNEKANLEYAESILGRDVIGPKQVSEFLKIEIPERDIPPLPFSKRDIDVAKENDLVLIFRVQHDEEGAPLTAERLSKLVLRHVPKGEQAYYGGEFVSRDDFNDSVRRSWALVSREPSIKGRYDKLPELAKEYVERIFSGNPPEELKSAIADFEQKPGPVKGPIGDYRLSELTMPKFLDAYYDKAMLKIGLGLDDSLEGPSHTLTPSPRGILATEGWEYSGHGSLDYYDANVRFTWAPSSTQTDSAQ
ncbi:MAG: hypothetical protein U0514_01475 [Candidatus Andersenbacteria bacterium]